MSSSGTRIAALGMLVALAACSTGEAAEEGLSLQR